MEQKPITLRALYPRLSDAQLNQAEANVRCYLAVLMRIADRLNADACPASDAEPSLTSCHTNANIPQRSNPRILLN